SNLVKGSVFEGNSSDGTVAIKTETGDVIYCITRGRRLGATVTLSIRTVHLLLHTEHPAGDRNIWRALVIRLVFLGDMTEIHAECFGDQVVLRISGDVDIGGGEEVFLSASPSHCVVLEDKLQDGS